MLTDSKLMDGTQLVDLLGNIAGKPPRIASSLLRITVPPHTAWVLAPDVAPPGGYSNYKRVQ